jgi:hypothetical protein
MIAKGIIDGIKEFKVWVLRRKRDRQAVIAHALKNTQLSTEGDIGTTVGEVYLKLK